MMVAPSSPTPRPAPRRSRFVLSLGDPDVGARALAGGKASALGRLLASGYPVPPGFVITTEATAEISRSGDRRIPAHLASEIAAAFETFGGGPFAVRSSGAAEDGEAASYAGMYETFLDVRSVAGLFEAILGCLDSADAARVAAYRGGEGRRSIAVLVQCMVLADAAGVAFTADPVSGDRDTVLVSAVRGLGDRLVSGAVSGEEWRARAGTLLRVREAGVLDREQTERVIALARRVAEEAGSPRDVEWAMAGGEVFLLQARPITALPDAIRWDAPPGAWVRNFRLGEWLGAPLSPSFATWGLPALEDGMHGYMQAVTGFEFPKPSHVLVNGWYFYGGFNLGSIPHLLRTIPKMVLACVLHFREFAAMTPPIAHLGFDHATRRWREELAPRYRALVAEVTEASRTHGVEALPELVDRILAGAGEQFGGAIGVAGYAAKAEAKLAAFWSTHLPNTPGSWLELVREGDLATSTSHDVQSIDWVHAMGGGDGVEPSAHVRERIVTERDATFARARAALEGRRSLQRRFEWLTAEAQRAHRVREEQSRMITLPWPALRRALTRLGERLVERRVLRAPEQVFFLERSEILDGLGRGRCLAEVAEERERLWRRQRRLAAPLALGELPRMYTSGLGRFESLLHGTEPPKGDELRGMPGSPGCVTGKVRLLHQIEELDRLLPGEVLVAPVTTPGWTPAFVRAAAVVTDSGSIASHASVVAREYGLPAVVATGHATSVLVDGDVVTVDGGRGLVVCISRDLERP